MLWKVIPALSYHQEYRLLDLAFVPQTILSLNNINENDIILKKYNLHYHPLKTLPGVFYLGDY